METAIGTPAPNCHILTNSPALHSLKRQQLVRLCKRNGIKATGTNADIIEKLKGHALNHPFSPSALGGDRSAFSSDDEGDKENKRIVMPRPSEAWSVIEEDSREVERVQLGLKDIREEVEQEMHSISPMKGFGTANSGEFGDGTTSSKGSTVTSSIKAFASSFRLGSKMSTGPSASMKHKMHTEEPPINDMLTSTSTPYHKHPPSYPALPSPQKLDADDSQDQSILGLGASTIRLVTTAPTAPSPPALRPFTPMLEPSYSLGSPSVSSSYPPLPVDDDSDHLPPGAFPSSLDVPSEPAKLSSPAPPPFIFGSPAHRTSNMDFNVAASSVLAEMNARLGLTGTSNAVGLDILQNRHENKASLFSLPQDKPRTQLTDKFNRVHEREFEKMEGLGEWYARRNAGSPGKSDPINKKRKSDALSNGPPRRVVGPSNPTNAHGRRGSRVVTPATRRSIVAAAQEEGVDQREPKRVRISVVENGDVRDKPTQDEVKKDADESDMDVDEQTPEERERERAAIKKRLEVSRARRRSSMGRVSVGGGRAPLIPNQPKKGMVTKFGFLSSAKTLMKSVWNRGAGTTEQVSKPDATVALPKATTVPPTKKALTVLTKHPPSSKSNATKPPQTKASTAKADPNSSLRVPAGGLGVGGMSSTKARTSSTLGTRSSVTSTNTSRLSAVSSLSSAVSAARRGPIPSFQQQSSRASRTSALGSRTSSTGTGTSRSTGASSIGIKKSNATSSSVRSSDAGKGSANGFIRKRTFSTLFAPTASSLAKMQSNVRPPSVSNIPSHPSRLGLRSLAKDSEQQLPVPNASGMPAFTFTSPRTGGIVSPPSKAVGSIFPDGPPTFSPSQAPSGETAPLKPRAPPSRRPRISRSRVIAKVGAQRAASGSSLTRTASGRRSLNAPRARGSVGLRGSGIGAKSTRDSVAMSARKRMRQSEILRRRSKVSGISPTILDREGTPESSLEDGKACDETNEDTNASIDVSMNG